MLPKILPMLLTAGLALAACESGTGPSRASDETKRDFDYGWMRGTHNYQTGP